MLDLDQTTTEAKTPLLLGAVSPTPLVPSSNFPQRHIGPDQQEIQAMLGILGYGNLEELISQAVPPSIRLNQPLNLPPGKSEGEALKTLQEIAQQNQVYRSFIGMGYYDCITPPVIQRNILENPGWYTAYTPYQAEIAQGRLEALLNFQTMVIDLTGLEIANASLLDEGTAAAEAMMMSYHLGKGQNTYFVADSCHPQVIEVVLSRAEPLGIEVLIGNVRNFEIQPQPVFGALIAYPTSDGAIYNYRNFCQKVHEQGGIVTVAADLLSLTLLVPPGEFGADIAIGNTQRFGVPLGYGGPHAAYFATKEDYKRHIPGRIVGVSKDSHGQPALRLALQTREQHIRREKATSNICTAQVLLAVISSMYAVYHGPEGLKAIAQQIHHLALLLAKGLKRLNYTIDQVPIFDTVCVGVGEEGAKALINLTLSKGINLRHLDPGFICISLDETSTLTDVIELWHLFYHKETLPFTVAELEKEVANYQYPYPFKRESSYLTAPVFNRYHSETELLRYLHQLESKDLSLTTSMIPLGSCTMKLNGTAEMIPITWPEFNKIHPFAPLTQTRGYQIIFEQLENWLGEITGLAGVSLQPNAGSQGEYTGLLVIRQYHAFRGENQRNICLIPESAHGTNPASAVMAGLKVVVVKCDREGNVEIEDLREKAVKYADTLAALMITYPSTHGVFEEGIKEICEIVHQYGGQVYLDGANLNAQVGLCRPGDFGADVAHLNLHKTFCIPHGGGGPGMGPIAVASHLIPFLPGHGVLGLGGEKSIGAIASAPWGSASILLISWMYIVMMGGEGLTEATKIAILNANYMARRLEAVYPILYQGKNGLVAHECIIDLRPLKKRAGVEVEDIAKRLMDYGFHAPTMSWPVIGTLMIEPTESESKEELDRFCEAMLSIYQEAKAIENKLTDAVDNVLKNAPHTAQSLICGEWKHPYTREEAAYPAPWTKEHKFWVSVGRIDNAYGDRHLVCSCVGMEAYQE